MREAELFWLDQVQRYGDLLAMTPPPHDLTAIDRLQRDDLIRPDTVTIGRWIITDAGRAALGKVDA